MKELFNKLFEKNPLSEEESYNVFKEIMEEKVSPVQTAAFLSLLKANGEKPSEIAGAAMLLRDKAIRIKFPQGTVLCDTCGTGGDNSGTFNISTCAAIIAFSCGLKVAKHGNRSVTSRCGSADVLEALGYRIDLEPSASEYLIKKHGFAFLYAPLYHKAMKAVGGVRKDLGFRTIFNIIGPLCNPAGSTFQIMGVSDYNLLKVIPVVFQKLGINGYVFHAENGIDEISLTGKTYIAEVLPGRIEEFEVYPQHFGLNKCAISELSGGDATENGQIIMSVLENRETGPRRDVVLLNTAFLLKASGAVGNIREGFDMALQQVKSGATLKKFTELLENVRAIGNDS